MLLFVAPTMRENRDMEDAKSKVTGGFILKFVFVYIMCLTMKIKRQSEIKMQKIKCKTRG